MTARLALHLLGAPRLELDNAPVIADRRKVLALLAYLAVDRWQHHRDHISGLFWPEYAQPKAFTNLRHVLWEVRQAIGDGWILTERDTIELNGNADIWLDVAQFESQIAQALAQQDLSLRLSLLTDSVQLYRNHFLTGFSLKDAPGFNEWAFTKSEDLRRGLARALAILADDLCSSSQAENAIPYGQRLVTLDPLNEAHHHQLMQVYIQAGQNSAALKQYQTCEKILRKELGLDPQPETRALYKYIRKGEIKPLQSVKEKEDSAPAHNLPLQLSKFIGREKELSEIASLIMENRLVTLVGTGGIGKTRLSLKVGEEVVNEYANGIWFAELAPLGDPALVPQTVAKLFNLVEQSGESLTEKLIRTLRPKTVLLILDNCEHLLYACAQLADALLKNCPNLKILATSREPLRITGEAQYHVPPLALPDIQQLLEQILGYESIQLFEERARLVQESFSLTTVNAASIAHICQRLDGIPLAIELAAARVNLLSAEQIASRLDENFNLLTGGSRTTLPRHQTLRASIDWSWQLLFEPEQILLRRLAVFAGGWTLDAAEAVCAGNGIESLQVLQGMTQLVAKSLVVVNREAESDTRYRLLEMVREYAHERLVRSGEAETVQNHHLKYFLQLSERIERELMGPQQMDWFERTNDKRDNVRAALEYASKSNHVEAGLYICARLKSFWEYFDNNEGLRWLAEFLQKPGSSDYPVAKAKALFTYGWFMATSHQFDAARSAAEECLVLCRASGDRHIEVDGLYLLGFISEGDKKTELCQQALALARLLEDPVRQTAALNVLGWDHSNLKRAIAYWKEAIPLYRQIGNRRSLANTFGRIGSFLIAEGDIETAEKYLDEADLLYQELNIRRDRDNLISAYGQIALLRGDYEKARACFQENALRNRELGSRMDYLWSDLRLGQVAMREGKLDDARQIYSDTVRSFQKDGYSIGIVVSLEWMASLHIAVGKLDHAARLIGWADVWREKIRNPRPVLEQADVDRDSAAVVTRIGRTAFEEAHSSGSTMTVDEAVALALDGA